MNLPKIIVRETGKKVVHARELHESLGLDVSNYAKWAKKNIAGNPYAIENEDYVLLVLSTNTRSEGRPTQDYALSMPFAKKLAMLARTDQGEKVRDYFLKCENTAVSKTALPDFGNPALAARAWADQFEKRALAEHKLHQAQDTIQSQAPKIHYYDEVLNSKDHITTTIIAKELGMSAIELNETLRVRGIQYFHRGQWILTSRYQDKGYTKTYTHPFVNSKGEHKTQKHTCWTEKGCEFIHNLINPHLQWDKPSANNQISLS